MFNFPPYEHKYLTVVSTEEEWNNIKDTFEECNYTMITNGDTTTNGSYFPSVRTTNEDNTYEMLYNQNDVTKTTFFLEILWGYFGWEWHDYEYTPEDAELDEDGNPIPIILTGGNLFKIKELTEVPSIPDGYRLQHINDFINSQDKVVKVNYFNTDNLISAQRAFKNIYRVGPKRVSDIPKPFYVDIPEFKNLVLADEMFYNRYITMNEDEYIYFPNVTSVNNFCRACIIYNNKFKFKFDKLTKLNGFFFYNTCFNNTFNVNDYIDEDTIKRAEDISYIVSNIVFRTAGDVTVSLDLRGNINEEITAASVFRQIYNGFGFDNPKAYTLNIDLKFDVPINLTYAFRNLTNNDIFEGFNDNGTEYFDGQWPRGFKYISIPFTDEEKSLITNLTYTFSRNYFNNVSVMPITAWNGHCDDSYMYYWCIFEEGCTPSYDFSPNHTINPNIDIFNKSTFQCDNLTLTNSKYLKQHIFTQVTFPTDYVYTDQICDENIDYGYVDEDRIEEFRGYKYINFSNSSLSRIADKKIYLLCHNTKDERILWDYNVHFRYCTNIDFPSTSEEDGYHLYVKNLRQSTDSFMSYGGTYVVFEYCTSMTETPYIHGSFSTEEHRMDRGGISFRGCTNLVKVRLKDFHVRLGGYGNTNYIYFPGCPNIEVFELGACSNIVLDFSECSKLCDTEEGKAALEETIMVQERVSLISILRTVFDKLSTECQDRIKNVDGSNIYGSFNIIDTQTE